MAAPATLRALLYCEKTEAILNASKPFKVKVRGKSPICLGAGTLPMVPVTCPHLESVEFLLEPLGFKDEQLPEGLLVSPSLVTSTKGLLYTPVVNVGTADVWLSPRRAIAIVQAVTAPSVETATSISVDPSWEDCLAYVSTQDVAACSSTSEFEGLNKQQVSQARALFSKYESLFYKGEGDDVPVRQPYRRLPPSQYETVRAHIQQLLDSKVIRESSSPFSSPIVMVMKKDVSLRLCVDYRQLNSKTCRDALPSIKESLDSLSGARWLSTLNLASGYNQVSVAEKDKFKTTYCTF